MKEAIGTLSIYMYLDVPSGSKSRTARRTLHTQRCVFRHEAIDIYQSFMRHNDDQFKNKDMIHGVWQPDPVYLNFDL